VARKDEPSGTGSVRGRNPKIIALALVEILPGVWFLHWALTRGVYDESSLGTVVFLWGSVVALCGLVIPGLLLLVRSPIRWVLQPLPALVLLLLALWLATGWFARPRPSTLKTPPSPAAKTER
jgi:hypothetical protein